MNKKQTKKKKSERKQGTKESWNCLEIATRDEAVLATV